MESSLKMFVLINKDKKFRQLDSVIKSNEEDALLYFLTLDSGKVFFNQPTIFSCMIRFADINQEELKLSLSETDITEKEFDESFWFDPYPLDKVKMHTYEWVLNCWGIDCKKLDVEEFFDSVKWFQICKGDPKINAFYEQFQKFPRKRQIQLGKLFMKASRFRIKSYPVTSIPGSEEITQSLKDEIKKTIVSQEYIVNYLLNMGIEPLWDDPESMREQYSSLAHCNKEIQKIQYNVISDTSTPKPDKSEVMEKLNRELESFRQTRISEIDCNF